MTKNKEIHIVYASEDGISSWNCGVGTIAKNFVSGFEEIRARLEKKNYSVRLSIITVKPDKFTVGKNVDLLNRSKSVCLKTGGELFQISYTYGESYFSYSQWSRANFVAREKLTELYRPTDHKTIILANDSFFGKTFLNRPRVVNVWIPHSLFSVHKQSYVGDRKKSWDDETIELYKNTDNHFVGCISEYVKEIFLKKYRFPGKTLPLFNNGFDVVSAGSEEKKYTTQSISKIMRVKGVPLNRDLILAYNRADEYKGLDIALQAIVRLTEKLGMHGVVIASKFSNERFIRKLQSKLLKLVKGAENRVTLFLGYEFDLPAYLIRYKRTKYLINTPVRDFCPLAPHEAEIFGNKELLVVNSDIPCFNMIIRNGYNGFLVKPEHNKIIDAVMKINGLDTKQKKLVHARAKKKSLERMNLPASYSRAIVRLVK